MKKYEAILIYAVTVKEDVLQKNVERVRGEITKLNGSVDDVQMLGSRSFARPLNKKDAGCYVKIRFTAEPANIHPLQARLKLIEDIFRMQIVCMDMRKKSAAAVKPAEEKPA